MDTLTRNIYNDIIELSDLSLQRKLWLNENNDTGLISSYVEVMCRLFDDNRFDDFIDNTASKIGLSSSTIFELHKLRELLNNYSKKEVDEEVIADSDWGQVVEQAKTVIKEWEKN
jgi:GDP-D-mannose dehydratase